MSEVLQKAITKVELREAELLSWGAVGAEWRRDELLDALVSFADPAGLLDRFVELGLIVETPSGGYRSRSAETVRILATLRQAFRNEAILAGRPLVLDYRFLHRPRRRPRREQAAAHLESSVQHLLKPNGLAALRTLAPPTVSDFQERSTQQVLGGLNSSEARGVVVTAGTGSGKTLAFYMPMLAWACDQASQNQAVLALALYPRTELLKDQLRTLVGYTLALGAVGSVANPVSLATWFGPTPASARFVREGKVDAWRRVTGGYQCPFLQCPSDNCEDGSMIWPDRQIRDDVELLRCTNCGTEVPGTILRLTRDSARSKPATVMLTTTESLNRQLASPGNLRAFGVKPATLRAVLLDEVHTYEGTTGAQNAYLLRRLRHALGQTPLWAGLSATLTDAGGFFGRLVNLDAGQISVVEPDPSELEESGAEYLLALRHNPHGNTGTLSTTIQTAMALSRSLDAMTGNPFNPPIDSEGIVGSRLFAFTDKLDSTNRLYWDLLDAEGWAWPGQVKRGAAPLTLAHLRSHGQSVLPVGRRQDPLLRDQEGQYWWLAESLGHEVDSDVQKRIGRTSSQDSGVASDADIIVATASLEVGFDDDRVGAVLQHKAPHDVAQFLQRKGRAGRNAATRPWTVVVLSDWGRDREAWDSYDALFSPVLPPRSLPLENLYVLRIQAVYSLLDWLAQRLKYGRNSTWADSAGPAELLGRGTRQRREIEDRQGKLGDLLSAVLRDGPERAALVRHLRRSLALGTGPAVDVILQKIMWESPRPLLAAVVPTLRRRLRDQWAGERPDADDSSVRTRTPLRDFVPGNLFDDLLVPDVEFNVPWARNENVIEHLPALRAIREFLPGNVSRHFGVWASNKRHWVPLPTRVDTDGTPLVDVATYGGLPIDDVATAAGITRVFAPTHVDLASVDNDVSDGSSMRADWVFSATAVGAGTKLRLARRASCHFEGLTAHLHSQGGGMRIVRFAETGRGVLWQNGQPTPTQMRFCSGEQAERAALGVEIYADALVGRVQMPSFAGDLSPIERTEWMRFLIDDDPSFPATVTTFDRAGLADSTESLAAKWDWATGPPHQQAFTDDLRQEAVTLGLLDPSNPGTLSACLGDAAVLTALRDHLLASRASTRSVAWLEWTEKRFTLAAAQTLLDALASSNRNVDADDLLVDLDPSDRTVFYISEQSPGGTGQVEALTIDMIETPDRLDLALADVLCPTDLERLDHQLRAVIESPDDPVRQAVADLAASWTSGHEAVKRATETLDTALAGAALSLDRTATVALTTRIAGPGADPHFLAEIREWIAIRDAAERRTGLAIGPRTLASLLADRTVADTFLHLANPNAPTRVRAVANVLWPWGRAARGNRTFNPYAGPLDGAVDLLRRHWRFAVEEVELDHWSDQIRSDLHARLRDTGELVLRAPIAHRRTLRVALIDLQTTPIEVGPLWCYPEIIGIHERGPSFEARIRLQETW
ncbi:protein DpdJ [Gordonia bronchialis]|uniref:protein DpdJ n=1 Tax=Gordonia bronchialis TaxID=2054 RepID=UPI00226DA60C|nr:protein DpdJ [Gordonia bronchialis]